MNTALANQLNQNTADLLSVFSQFSDEDFQHKNINGGWTPARIAAHLAIFDTRTLSYFDGDAVASERDPQEKLPVFSERLSDRINKIDAPEALVPPADAGERGAVLETLVNKRNALVAYVNSNDLTYIVQTPHRLFGPLSRQEWIQLTIRHCMRHIEQLKDILAA